MRTKSRGIRRHSIHQNLEGDGSVGIRVGVGGSGHDVNGYANSGTIVQGFDGDAPLMGSVNANWVGTGDVPATLGMFMDVDDELCKRRFPVAVDVAEKGKRKVGDVPASVDNGCYAVGHCIRDIPFIGGCVADSRSASYIHIAAEAVAPDTHNSFQPPRASPPADCPSGSFISGVQPNLFIVRPEAVVRPYNGALPSTRPDGRHHLRVLFNVFAILSRRCTSRRRQTRVPTGSPVPVQGHRGAPAEYVSLGLCNRVCRHCKALFCFQERLAHGSACFPEYHKCCMGGVIQIKSLLVAALFLQKCCCLILRVCDKSYKADLRFHLKEFLEKWPPRHSPGINDLVQKLKESDKTAYLISGGFRQMINSNRKTSLQKVETTTEEEGVPENVAQKQDLSATCGAAHRIVGERIGTHDSRMLNILFKKVGFKACNSVTTMSISSGCF
ncbi:HAD-like domain-containing protein [Artemisia annua]|uniref:HAD-like domain-containing protein n=1 Tax=Artemisia annua TaxID=35608 RepID=A0A2U1KFJ2_ARTAN|nr:HAD-like domain-containing protein [Artemisia annua]